MPYTPTFISTPTLDITGGALTLRGATAISKDANGATSIQSTGTNQNVTILPSGSGIVAIESQTNQLATLQVKATNNSALLYLINTAATDGGSNDVSFYKGTTTEYARVRGLSGAGNTGKLLFYTNNGTSNAERARIESTGNFLIGSTSDNGSALQVAGNATISGTINGITITPGTGTLTPLPSGTTVDTEYISPEQHGGIYGTVYRMYFGSSLPAYLTTGNPVAKLVNANVHFQRTATSVRYSSSAWSDAGTGTEYIRLVHSNLTGSGPLVINASGCVVISGWVDYTK